MVWLPYRTPTDRNGGPWDSVPQCAALASREGITDFLASLCNGRSFLEPAELFVQYLATYSYLHGSGKEKKALTYSDLANTAEESETFQFLADILPKKILASKYLKMLKEEKREEDEEEDNDNDDEGDDDEAES
ncbi:PREDICTED: chromatin accessibility complex protein 1 [Galeopterus variegatus]|uniref:Chromatin accessibility complex protein 1 n=1 Tax=Galeopterus variegatus TaxID=482537 RepID=A0ABM0QEA6_GALVR|nr:PREDICTED: chromatin accessibility complex protein 1 [Galeopterus variegatus]